MPLNYQTIVFLRSLPSADIRHHVYPPKIQTLATSLCICTHLILFCRHFRYCISHGVIESWRLNPNVSEPLFGGDNLGTDFLIIFNESSLDITLIQNLETWVQTISHSNFPYHITCTYQLLHVPFFAFTIRNVRRLCILLSSLTW